MYSHLKSGYCWVAYFEHLSCPSSGRIDESVEKLNQVIQEVRWHMINGVYKDIQDQAKNDRNFLSEVIVTLICILLSKTLHMYINTLMKL